MSDDPFTQLINQILQDLVSRLNGQIGQVIHNAGYDPYQNVTSGSASIGVGTASYSINNLKGVSSVQIKDIVVGNLQSSGPNITGQLNLHAVLMSSLVAQVSGDVKVWPFDPGISGYIRIDSSSIAGTAQFQAGVNAGKICITSVSNLNANFNYGNASVWIDGLGDLNSLLQPVENLILDAAKGAICGLISLKIGGIVSGEINKLLPQCVSFP